MGSAAGSRQAANAPVISRVQVTGYRLAAHDLITPGEARAVLATGLQAHPTARTAMHALRLRSSSSAPPPGTVLLHAARSALHLHRAADAGLLARALRIDCGRDLTPATAGPFAAEVEQAGIGLGPALDLVADAMRDVMADGMPRTKGQLSGAVTPLVDRRLAPWCPGCQVYHVNDLLFRAATLQARLGIAAEDNGPGSYHRLAAAADEPPRDRARTELVRRFLHAFGPAASAHLAAWLGVTSAAAQAWWGDAKPALVRVQVEGRARWALADDVAALTAPPDPRGVRLLPPYDPFIELADREFAVPDAARRRQVWRPAGGPGVLLVDGEIAGVWRQKTARSRLTITITTFGSLQADRRHQADADAQVYAAAAGARDVELRFA